MIIDIAIFLGTRTSRTGVFKLRDEIEGHLQQPHEIDLVVNTTSVGMYPAVDTCPWPSDVPMSDQMIFYDLVYNPLETVFLSQARAAGAQTINGLGMLVHQAAFGFEKWTGHPAPIEVMRQACLKKLVGE